MKAQRRRNSFPEKEFAQTQSRFKRIPALWLNNPPILFQIFDNDLLTICSR
jgi:hypothetical protein